MPDWLTGLIVLYALVGIAVFWIPLAHMPWNHSYYRWRRQKLARVALTAPVWPVWILIGIVYGIYRLIQIARTGE